LTDLSFSIIIITNKTHLGWPGGVGLGPWSVLLRTPRISQSLGWIPNVKKKWRTKNIYSFSDPKDKINNGQTTIFAFEYVRCCHYSSWMYPNCKHILKCLFN